MNANSPPCASSRPPSRARPQLKPPTRNTPPVTRVLISTRPTTDAAIQYWWVTTSRTSMPMPTDMKNRPINNPLKGSIVTSTSWRYWVSATRSPAMNAPRAIDRPAAAVAPAVLSATSKVSAMKTSGWCWRAKRRNTGSMTRRPTTKISVTTTADLSSVSDRVVARPLEDARPRMSIRISSGTTARSCSIRMANTACPSGCASERCCASSCSTTAVEDRLSTRPSTTATLGPLPKTHARLPMISALSSTWALPPRNTQRRIDIRRWADNSRPIRNIRKITPRSASDCTPWSREKVRFSSHGQRSTHSPMPLGPTRTPTARKPRIWLMRNRCSSGIRMPTSVRKSRVSRRNGIDAEWSIVEGVLRMPGSTCRHSAARSHPALCRARCQMDSGSMRMAPHGHSATHTPQPLQ